MLKRPDWVINHTPLKRVLCGYISSNNGSSTTFVVLILMTVILIVGAITMFRHDEPPPTIPQASQQLESQAFYIAQTALDRSIKELVADPKWRDGFSDFPFERGKFNVRVFDATAQNSTGQEQNIPPNYVRIVASSELDGVTKEVEAVWVDAMSAFNYVFTAGNSIEVGHDETSRNIVVGNIHCNAWEGGFVRIRSGTTFYGDLSTVGDIHLGADHEHSGVTLYGNAWGAQITVSPNAEIREYENLSEWTEGVDLDGDGDSNDFGLNKGPLEVAATIGITSDGRSLGHADTNPLIGGGSAGVSVGEKGIGPIIDPRPDFTTYYELVTGTSTYPPALDHVVTPILGDGDGHYFSSAERFVDWLEFQNQRSVACWRCAGEGQIDPGNTTMCPNCTGSGEEEAVEIAGVFYIDDAELSLGDVGRNLVVHGTIVIAKGDPYRWPEKTVYIPGATATIDHFPEEGRLSLKGHNRMHFTQTYRSDEEGGSYVRQTRMLYRDENTQAVTVSEPNGEHAMRDFPAILVPATIEIEPRRAGFAYHPGDIGDEKLTVVQGVIFAEEAISLHGQGGWSGDSLVFDEELQRRQDEELDESVFNVDLNGDSDVFDRVPISAVSTIPVIPISNDRFNIDINNDGVLNQVTIGADYRGFFAKNELTYPALIHHEGLVLSQSIHMCDQVSVVFDPQIAASGVPFGFEVSFGSTTYQGLVSWWERHSR